MTDAPDNNGYCRKHYTIDDNTENIVDSLAENHHNGNSSEAVRASVRFRDRWSLREKSLPTEIMHVLDEILSTLEELESDMEALEERIESTERAASDESGEDVNRSRQKRQIMAALSQTNGKRIDTIAEEVGLPLVDAVAAAEELEDNDRIVRTNNGEKEVRFKKLK